MKRDYDEQYELRRYVWRNYRHALFERERALYTAATLELKARHARTDNLAARIRQMPGYFFEADVAAIVSTDSLSAFERQCCERLLHDCVDQIYVKRCERCERIAASPIACACVWCGHHWYERRAEMVARSQSAIYPKPQ